MNDQSCNIWVNMTDTTKRSQVLSRTSFASSLVIGTIPWIDSEVVHSQIYHTSRIMDPVNLLQNSNLQLPVPLTIEVIFAHTC